MKLFGNKNEKRDEKRSDNNTRITKEPEGVGKAELRDRTAQGATAASSGTGSVTNAKSAEIYEKQKKRTREEEIEIEAEIARYQKKKMIRRFILLGVLLVIVIAGIIAALAVKAEIKPPDVTLDDGPPTFTPDISPGMSPEIPPSASPSASPSPTGSSTRKEGFYTFILVGNDDGNGGTDTMILGAYDSVNKKLNLCSIPRDTLVNVSWETKKINTLLPYGGTDRLKSGLRDIMGFTVDNCFVVDLEAFVALVDALDGVYFYVPQDMHYEAPDQDFYIHLTEGYQHLDGNRAMQLVRYRSYPSGDIQRIKVQQDFMKAVVKQTLQLGNLFKINDFVTIFEKYVNTDLSWGNLAWYGLEFLSLKEEDIRFFTLPENYNDSVKGFSYCTILIDEWIEMVNTYFNPYKIDIAVENLNILTRNENGELYATTGSIAGGYDSFADFDEMFGDSGGEEDGTNQDGDSGDDVLGDNPTSSPENDSHTDTTESVPSEENSSEDDSSEGNPSVENPPVENPSEGAEDTGEEPGGEG